VAKRRAQHGRATGGGSGGGGVGVVGVVVGWRERAARSFAATPARLPEVRVNPTQVYVNPTQVYVNPTQVYVNPTQVNVNPTQVYETLPRCM
jgi:hypothetical protein